MANIFEKGTKFAATAMELLKRQIKTPTIFKRWYGKADFAGALGDTVNIKRPPLLRARDKGWRTDNAIQVDQIAQSSIKVTLTHFPYSAVELAPEEATLDEVDYVRDVQAPQVQAMGVFFEDLIVDTLREADYVLKVRFDPASSTEKEADARKVASRARKLFTDNFVPTSGRYWLVGSAVAEAIRDTTKLLDVDTSGLPEALREGVVTRLSGFTIVELDALGEFDSFFVHEDAVAIANVAPVVPKGAVGGASITGAGGLAITQVWDYDSTHARDRSIVQSFAGATPVEDPQVGRDKRIVLGGDGKPVMQFVRGIECVFVGGDPAEWEATAFYGLGDRVKIGAGVVRVTQAGETGATKPTLPSKVGDPVTDGTVVWQRVS